MKTYIGIDNGISGTMAFIRENESFFSKTPIFKCQDYTKSKKMVSRLDVLKFMEFLDMCKNFGECFILLERPMLNPNRYTATISAARCHESMLTCIELSEIPYQFIDSKEWQKELLPKNIHGDELKTMSLEIGNRLFPKFKNIKHPDRDAILIAEYAKRKNF